VRAWLIKSLSKCCIGPTSYRPDKTFVPENFVAAPATCLISRRKATHHTSALKDLPVLHFGPWLDGGSAAMKHGVGLLLLLSLLALFSIHARPIEVLSGTCLRVAEACRYR
jgi:hypothetical protein